MNITPLAEISRRFSHYTYTNNNPIFFVDPDGRFTHSFDSMNPNDTEDAFDGKMMEDFEVAPPGDYYDKNGNHLGSDGKNDNKAYFADGINSDSSFKNAKELSVSNSVLNQLANTVAEESSGNWKESFAIASTIVNLSIIKAKLFHLRFKRKVYMVMEMVEIQLNIIIMLNLECRQL